MARDIRTYTMPADECQKIYHRMGAMGKKPLGQGVRSEE
jgi:hypothetical protein